MSLHAVITPLYRGKGGRWLYGTLSRRPLDFATTSFAVVFVLFVAALAAAESCHRVEAPARTGEIRMPSGTRLNISTTQAQSGPGYRTEEEWDEELVRAYESGQWAVPLAVVALATKRKAKSSVNS